jgi:hypothetical protein
MLAGARPGCKAPRGKGVTMSQPAPRKGRIVNSLGLVGILALSASAGCRSTSYKTEKTVETSTVGGQLVVTTTETTTRKLADGRVETTSKRSVEKRPGDGTSTVTDGETVVQTETGTIKRSVKHSATSSSSYGYSYSLGGTKGPDAGP